MSLQELKFYKCKHCLKAELIAGKYCVDCAKIRADGAKALNMKDKTIGYPYINPNVTPDHEQEFTGSFGTSAGTCSIGTTTVDLPVWTSFTSAGNATNIDTSAFGSALTVSSGTVMDLGFGTNIADTKNSLSGQRKTSRHK